jgi:hypothetical protein
MGLWLQPAFLGPYHESNTDMMTCSDEEKVERHCAGTKHGDG